MSDPSASAPDLESSAFPARAIVDLDAIAGNVAHLARLAPRSQVMAVVKADAYGHGIVPSARAAIAGGASWLGVAQLAEAVRLREAGVTGPRLLTWIFAPGPDTNAALERAIALDIDLSAGSTWSLEAIADAARSAAHQNHQANRAHPARLHLKVDTGLARGGAFLEPWTELLHRALELEADGVVDLVGVWSHLATAEDLDHPATDRQLEVFHEALQCAESAGARLEVRHLANSAATLLRPDTHFDLVRPGLAVFGLSPIPGRSAADLGLTPAMRLEAQVLLVKEAGAGQGVSYGHTYSTTQETVLADIPLGYADGIPRHASAAGPVLLGGRRRTVAGRVCMDQFVVDLDGDTHVQPGDTAVLWGTGRDGEPTAEEWAQAAGTISYEIVTRLGARVPRVYTGSAGRTDRLSAGAEQRGTDQ